MKSVLLLRDPVNPYEDKLWSAFEAASKKVKAAQVSTKGGSGSEYVYSIAYQNLAREGLVERVKRKYRG